MQHDDLLTPLHHIIHSAQTLLSEEYGLLNVGQTRMVESIARVARDMLTLFVSIPDLTSDEAKKLVSYETRTNLASVIGYAEVLLDETEGMFTPEQAGHAHHIRASGKQLLTRVSTLIDA
jgi:signal transduction histidine kinase